MRKNDTPLFKNDWLSKTLAGIFPCLILAYGIIAIFAWFGPGGIQAANKVQFNMWMITPLWLTFFSLVYLFPSGKKAWVSLLVSNAVIYGIYFSLKALL